MNYERVDVAGILVPSFFAPLPVYVTAWHKFDNLLDIKILSSRNFPFSFRRYEGTVLSGLPRHKNVKSTETFKTRLHINMNDVSKSDPTHVSCS